MAAITASMVNDLRARTGLGMMECKKMLTETGGDIEKAIEAFRKKGVKTSILERAANEGRLHVAAGADRQLAVAVEVVCNTDFTAKTEAVTKVLEAAAAKLLANPDAKLSEDAAIGQQITDIAKQTGENVQLGRTVVLKAPAGGIVGTYLYSTSGKGKIAVLMALSATADAVVNPLGMHITAARPLALTRAEVPADVVAKEKEIAVEQAKASGKPQQIAEKIAEGKMNSFYAERVLLDQVFFNPDFHKGTVSELLKKNGVTLQKYVRLEVGQQ